MIRSVPEVTGAFPTCPGGSRVPDLVHEESGDADVLACAHPDEESTAVYFTDGGAGSWTPIGCTGSVIARPLVRLDHRPERGRGGSGARALRLKAPDAGQWVALVHAE